jgi:hypothetical protein
MSGEGLSFEQAGMSATRTFTIDRVDDRDGIMSVERAPHVATVYGVDDFDGGWVEMCGNFDAARTITITLTSGPWNSKEPVVIEGAFGSDDGMLKPQREELELPGRVRAGESIVVRGKQPFMFPPGVSITFPAQPQRARLFTVGAGDIYPLPGGLFEDVRATADGVLAVRYSEGHDDALELARGERLGLRVTVVIAEQTEHGVTLFFSGMRTVEEPAPGVERSNERDTPGSDDD